MPSDLEKRLQIVEDTLAIIKLKSLYGQACDLKYDQKMLSAMFTEDAVWDGGKEWGVHKGKKAVMDFFKGVAEGLEFAVHYFVEPDITIDSDTKAHAHWYAFMPCTMKGGKGIWLAATEDDEYRKVNGKWMMSRVKLNLLFQTPYESGWHKKRIAD